MDFEKELEQLIKENDKLRKEYRELISDIKSLKELNIKEIYGTGWRYKIARWLMKK